MSFKNIKIYHHIVINPYISPITTIDVISSRDELSEVDANGYLTVMGKGSFYKSFNLDVGFNRGQTTLVWHEYQKPENPLFVIGVEANNKLIAHYEKLTQKGRTYVDFLRREVNTEKLKRNTILIRAAVGSKKKELAHLNPGFGHKV